MPGGSNPCLGNELFEQMLYLPSIAFPTLSANASADNTATVNGVLPGDLISWNLQAPPSHLVLDNVYVSAANTLSFRWSTDATGVTGANVAILLAIARSQYSSQGVNVLPNQLV